MKEKLVEAFRSLKEIFKILELLTTGDLEDEIKKLKQVTTMTNRKEARIFNVNTNIEKCVR